MSYKKVLFLICFLTLLIIPSIQALNAGTKGKSFFTDFSVYEELRELNSEKGIVYGNVKAIYFAYKGDGDIHKFDIHTQDGSLPVMFNEIKLFLDRKKLFPDENIKFEDNFANTETLLFLNLTDRLRKVETNLVDMEFEYSYNITLNKDVQKIKNIGIISSCDACNQSYYKEFILPERNEPISKEGARYSHKQWTIELAQDERMNTIVYKSIWNFYWWLLISAFIGAVLGFILSILLIFFGGDEYLRINGRKLKEKICGVFSKKKKKISQKLTKEEIEEHKAVNIALASGFFVIAFVTFMDIMGEVIRKRIPSFTPWLEKVVLLVIIYFLVKLIVKNHLYITRKPSRKK